MSPLSGVEGGMARPVPAFEESQVTTMLSVESEIDCGVGDAAALVA